MKSRIQSVPAAVLAVGSLCGPAAAQLYTLEFGGEIENFIASANGADQFPFSMTAHADPLLYHFEYDISAAPVSFLGERPIYEFEDGNSWVRLGDTTVVLDGIRITVGSVNGESLLFVDGWVESLDFTATAELFGFAEIPNALPTSIDLEDFNSARNLYANNDANQFLLPIVLGSLDSASIVPAPAGMFVLALGAAVAPRRLRNGSRRGR